MFLGSIWIFLTCIASVYDYRYLASVLSNSRLCFANTAPTANSTNHGTDCHRGK